MPAIAKTEAELKRPRSRKGGDQQATLVGVRREVKKIKPADPDWHPIAKDLYNGAKTSGQSDYYQDTDWAMLFSLCEDLSNYKKSTKRSSMALTAIMAALQSLLITEGDRRKVRMELREPEKPKVNLAETAENVIYPDAFKAG